MTIEPAETRVPVIYKDNAISEWVIGQARDQVFKTKHALTVKNRF